MFEQKKAVDSSKNKTKPQIEKKSKPKQDAEKDIVSKVVEKSDNQAPTTDQKVKPVNFKALNMSDSQ